MKTFGGFIGAEPPVEKPRFDADGFIQLAYGRSCLNAILETIKPQRVHLPYFICDSVLEVLKKQEIAISFYVIDANLEQSSPPPIQTNEMMIAINYFGLKEDYVRSLSDIYGDKLIIDCSQSFYSRPTGASFLFNSYRKFFGVGDGAGLYWPSTNGPAPGLQIKRRLKHSSPTHLRLLADGDVRALQSYQDYEANLSTSTVRMSESSQCVMAHLDTVGSGARRMSHYMQMHKAFKSINLLSLPATPAVPPLAYPLHLDLLVSRTVLASRGLFVPSYWPEVASRCVGFAFEKSLATSLLPLPIDQRMSDEDCAECIRRIREVLGALQA